MQYSKEIELSSAEITAYWWINVIRNKVRELTIRNVSDEMEKDFVGKFYNFTEKDWRNLYLELVNYIIEDINSYVPIGNVYGIDSFNQDIAKDGHNRLNDELSKIMECSIPDIRLAKFSVKDSVIYTNIFGVNVWYKSCGVTKLYTKYEPSYVLTGDERCLDFYYQMLATVAVLKEQDENFKM